MKPTQILVMALIGALIGAATGFGIKLLGGDDAKTTTEAHARLQPLSVLPDFSYADLEGRIRHAREWRDRILVLNFWAAWCPPCREETPMFVELQRKYAQDNVRFVGIAIDDRAPVEKFVESNGVEYPILIGDLEAIRLSKQLGNRFEGLPFTVIAAPGGNILLRHQGGMRRDQLEPALEQAIEQGQRTYASPERI